MLVLNVRAADWPQWRCNAGRTAATPEELPAELHVQWWRQLPPPRAAWPQSQEKLQFDASYEPVVMGKTIFVPSMVSDSLTAYDTDTGDERWRFYADGPVRFAPVAYRGNVYFVSDDGSLYCLKSDDGSLVWKFRGGPSDRKVIGNDRLISAWPARGAPVLYDGKIYFAASIWPFMGIFIHALDAQTGNVIWTNSGSGSIYVDQQHNSPAFAGVAPQGYMAATEDKLLVSGGRTVPAVYDRATGEFLYFHVSSRQFGKAAGGYEVAAFGEWFFNGGAMYRLMDGSGLLAPGNKFFCRDGMYSCRKDTLVAEALPVEIEETDAQGNKRKKVVLKEHLRARLATAPERIFLKAGNRLYGARSDGTVIAIDLRGGEKGQDAAVSWQGKVGGEPWSMLAADRKLFVVTREGLIYCFGGNKTKPKTHLNVVKEYKRRISQRADVIFQRTGVSQGYCVFLGIGSGGLAEDIARSSNLHVIAVDPDARKVAAFRRRMNDYGQYGRRIAAHVGDPATFPFPPYLADLIVSEDLKAAGLHKGQTFARQVFRVLRPYGGAACLFMNVTEQRQLANLVEALKLPGAEVETSNDGPMLLKRTGALPGSGSWTHQYADAGNTVVSKDQLVRAPLGLLWFGGPPNDPVLPRHGHGPAPQVVGGRLFIEGADMLRAVDVYTGRLLWEKALPAIGKFYDNTAHQPGANEIGSNYVSLADGIYVTTTRSCLRLDPATGKTLKEFALPDPSGGGAARWGFVAVSNDFLIATTSPVNVSVRGDKLAANMKHLIKPNAEWQYLAGRHPEEHWTQLDFAPAGWKTGPAGFGYADDDDKTVLDDMQGNYGAMYLRRKFNVQDADGIRKLALMISYDDGFIAYLNGKEVVRSCVGKGRGAEAVGIAGHEAQGYEYFGIGKPGGILREGENVLAIEGHNQGLGSSDFSLDPYLVYGREGLPEGHRPGLKDFPGVTSDADYSSASATLVVMNRYSGKVLWSREATNLFRHNAVVAGAGKVFCIDGLSKAKVDMLKRRGILSEVQARLYAFDIRTGNIAWQARENVLGTWLGYSAEHDVLLQAGSRATDRAADEIDRGMIAYRGADGKILWQDLERGYSGPCLLHHGTIITQGYALDLLTGKRWPRKHPLTGETIPWTFTRNYGCNTVIGSEHLLTFRSAAAGYFDLANDGGTGSLGGFKSGCTSNLIVADGVLNAPDYTRTCTCSYQNQCSLAMVHDPDAEMWTISSISTGREPIRRLGINFGAPGDRLAEDGTLWLEYPAVGGPSPEIPINMMARWSAYRRHSSSIAGGGLKWVAASGVRGAGALTVGLAPVTNLLVSRCDAPPSIDGKLDDPCWQNAPSVPFAAGADQRDPKVRLLICRDDSAIYFAYRREAAEVGGKIVPLVATQTGAHDAGPWADDDIEIVLTDRKRLLAAQLAISCAGGRYDGLQPTPEKGWADAKWDGDWQHAVIRTQAAWATEVRVPYETLRKAGIDSATLAINMLSQNLSGIGERSIFLMSPGPLGLGRCQRFLTLVEKREPPRERNFTVRLHFAELDGAEVGERVFDVMLQGNVVLKDFDVVKEAGGPNRAVVKEFKGIKVSAALTVELIPHAELTKATAPIISGIEALAE